MSNSTHSIRYILTDIEGTTSSISFVTDELFPYFRSHCDRLIPRESEPFIKEQLEAVKATAKQEGRDLVSNADIIQELINWSLEDRKATPLKALQGLVWNDGYVNGELKGHVYEDVPTAFEKWKNDLSLELGVFSSGSIAAQKLLFGHTIYGDLNRFFSNYFDTTTGPKRETETYLKIAEALKLEPNQILFLSDIKEELEAADEAGLKTIQLVRNSISGEWDTTVTTFSDIEL